MTLSSSSIFSCPYPPHESHHLALTNPSFTTSNARGFKIYLSLSFFFFSFLSQHIVDVIYLHV